LSVEAVLELRSKCSPECQTLLQYNKRITLAYIRVTIQHRGLALAQKSNKS